MPCRWDRRFVSTLDLGCGTGLAGVEFRSLTDSLTGVDLSPRMVALAQAKNLYDRLAVAELTDFLSAESGCYDLFISTDVLVYIGKLDDLFPAIARRASPPALFAFSAEVSTDEGYKLQDSGRYAHSRDYLEEQLARAVPLLWEYHPIRLEQGEACVGHHVVAVFNP